MKHNSIAILVINCFLSFTSYGIKYYISPLGNDLNSGTSTSTAWQTTSKINAKDFKGDTILFQGGSTFYGRMYFTSKDIGTSTKPIVIGSYGTGKAIINSDSLYGIFIHNAAGFVIKDLVFTGVSRLTNKQSGLIFYMDSVNTKLSFLKLDNVEVYGYRDMGISIGSWATASGYKDISINKCISHDNGRAGISIYAMEPYTHRNVYLGYNKVYNNPGIPGLIAENTGSGIVLGHLDIAVVEYCTSYSNGGQNNDPSIGGPVGIWAYASDSVTFQYNESHHNKTGNGKDGGGFDFDGGCTNSIMQYNYSHDNHGGGYLMAQHDGAPIMKNITIRYNISENDGRVGDQGSIHLWSSTNSGGIQTVKIYNNTTFTKPSTNAAPKGFYIRSGPISDIKVRNNIFQTTGGVPLVQVPYNTSACTFQGNSYWPSGSTFKIIWGTTTYSSLTAWRTGTANIQEYVNGVASGIQADAQFADSITGITFNDATKLTTLKRYKLKSTSGLINKGLDLKTKFGINVGARDYWGNSLANKTTFHIGAFQGTPIATTTPVTLSEITSRNDDFDANSREHILQVLSNRPAQNSLIVNFASAEHGKVSIVLYNLQGQLVKYIFSGEVQAADYKQFRIETDQLTNGIYIIHAQIGSSILMKKIIIYK